MKQIVFKLTYLSLFLGSLLFNSPTIAFASSIQLPDGGVETAVDWPWRGPFGNGIAPESENPPLQWNFSTGENILWRVAVPGRGHSSPIIGQGRIFLTTANVENQTQSVLCFDEETGVLIWEQTVNQGNFLARIHPTNTHASASVALLPGIVFATFTNEDSVQVAALEIANGKILWEKRVAKFVPAKYFFGNGASLIIHQNTLLVTTETEADAVVLFLDPKDGQVQRRIKRPLKTSYSTPVIAEIGGREQLLLSGGSIVAGYEPNTGKELWKIPASWEVSCGTMVWNQKRNVAFASGGFPANQTLAIDLSGAAKIKWENRVKCYEQSLIVVGDEVYGFAEGGILYCWDAETGAEHWSKRLKGGESASPVYAAGHLFISNELGTTYVIKPDQARYQEVARNQTGDEQFASIAVHKQRLVLRVADSSSVTRQEYLVCVGLQTETPTAESTELPVNIIFDTDSR